MTSWYSTRRQARPWPLAYGMAAALVVAMVAGKLLLDSLIGGGAPFLHLLVPVILSAWWGGLGPGLFATVLAGTLGAFFFLSPATSFLTPGPDTVRLCVYLAEGVFVSLLGELRLRSEHRLIGQREWFEVTLGSVGDAVIATDPMGRVTFLNATAEKLTGWPRSEALGQTLDDVFRILDERTRERVEVPVARVLQDKRVRGVGEPVLLVARDHREIPIQDSAAPIRDASGNVIGVVLVFRDASPAREAETALRDSERRFRMLADTAPVLIWISGTDRLREWCNEPWLQFTGRTMKQELGNGWARGVHPEDLERCMTTYVGCFDRRDSFQMEYRLLRHDGEYRWILDSGIPRFDRAGTFAGYIGSCVDITDLHRATRHLAAQYAIIDSLAKAGDLSEAAPAILAALCENLEWDVGAIWRLDARRGELYCVGFWHVPHLSCPEFEALTRKSVFSEGRGLPGRVLAAKGPSWIRDVLQDTNFPRATVAARENIRGAAAFPVRADGETRGVVELFSRQVREPDPKLLELMGAIGNQIGQFLSRKASEIAVRESEARKVSILEAALEAVIMIDHEGRVLEVNPAAERMFGRSWEELAGKEMAAFLMPEELRARYREGMARYLASGEGPILGKRLEMPALRADGSTFPVELTVLSIPVEGQPMFTGYIRDLTERKRTETATRFLADASEALASSLDYEVTLDRVARLAVPALADWSGIHMLEQDGSIRQLALWHSEPEELALAAELVRDYPLDPGAPHGAPSVIRSGQPELLEVTSDYLRSIARDERHFELLVRLGLRSFLRVPLKARGRILGAISLATAKSGRSFDQRDLALAEELARRASLAVDNTLLYQDAQREISFRRDVEVALRKKAEELTRSNAELERFAYLASHDLQEPLRAVSSYTQLLSDRYSDQLDEDANEFIGYAVEGVRRMHALINDLLAYSRVGDAGSRHEPTDLGEMLDSALANLQEAITESEAVITRDRLPTVLAPRANMLHLFQNLIGNALKFKGDSPPRIHVGAARENGEWLLRVQDNGIGIDPRYHEQVFLIFKRLHHRSEYPGTGVGLAICKKTVEQLGGRIWVESRLGAGATFYFTIPAGDDLDQGTKPPSRTSPSTQ